MTRCLMILFVLGGAFCSARTAWSQLPQSTYTKSALGAIATNNSASGFSSQQIRSSIYNNAVPRNNYSTANRGLFNSSLTGRPMSSPRSKPFSHLGSGGGPSPWLSLSDPFASTAHSYYTQVRPQLDQQRANQQQAARMMKMQQQYNALAAQGPYDPQGSERMAPTGHGAAYMNYAGYYQPVQPTKQRPR